MGLTHGKISKLERQFKARDADFERRLKAAQEEGKRRVEEAISEWKLAKSLREQSNLEVKYLERMYEEEKKRYHEFLRSTSYEISNLLDRPILDQGKSYIQVVAEDIAQSRGLLNRLILNQRERRTNEIEIGTAQTNELLGLREEESERLRDALTSQRMNLMILERHGKRQQVENMRENYSAPDAPIKQRFERQRVNTKSQMTGKANVEVDDCVICCETLHRQRWVMNCGHDMFHEECIRRWMREAGAPNCPVCRAPADLPPGFVL